MMDEKRTIWQRLTGSGQLAVAPKTERRFWVRYPSDRQTLVRLDDTGAEPFVAKVQDVSRGGLRLLVHRAIEAGTMIRVELPAPEGRPPTTVLACVVHERPGDDGGYSIGCRFSTELSDEDLQGLGARLERPLGVEQRASDRVPARGRVIFRSVTGEDLEQSAPIHNISFTGVAIVLDDEIDPGTLLSMDIMDMHGTTVLTIVACVVYISNAGGGKWITGCNFIRELDEVELASILK